MKTCAAVGWGKKGLLSDLESELCLHTCREKEKQKMGRKKDEQIKKTEASYSRHMNFSSGSGVLP